MQKFITAILISLGLFLVAFYSWDAFFMAVVPKITGVRYQANLISPFRNPMIFGLAIALIPILSILVWKFARVSGMGARSLAIAIIVLVIVVSVLMRRQMIISKASNLTNLTAANPKPIHWVIPIDSLNFELFALVGALSGAVNSALIIRYYPKSENI